MVVAAHSAIGFGDSELKGRTPPRAVFLCPQHGKPLWAGRVGALRGCRFPFGRFANLHGFALPFGDGKAD